MTEYIERELAKRAVDYAIELSNSEYDAVCNVLDGIPSADVAPVVRCKDCKHSWKDISGLCCSYRVCIDLNVPRAFYCAYGERKDGGTNNA